MTLMERIARCERETHQCREAASTAGNNLDRYGHTWNELDWLVARQLYEDGFAAAVHEIRSKENLEDQDGLSIGC